MEYTKDGYKLTVYSTLYMEYGLTIEKDGKELFSNPHVFSCESYGSACQSECEYECECDEARPWTDKEWSECLEDEFDTLIEAYLGPIVTVHDEEFDCDLHICVNVEFSGDIAIDAKKLDQEWAYGELEEDAAVTDYYGKIGYAACDIFDHIDNPKHVQELLERGIA